jgi:pimeloyl-ACP methyl ester carboxylesterase
MASFGIESAHIIGNSYGAYTGLFLAFRHPERAQTLVLSEPPVFPLLDNNAEGRKHRNDFLEKVWEPAGKILEQGEMEKGVRKFVDGVVSDGAFDQFPQKVKNLIMDNACEFKTETLSPDFWTPFTCKEAKKITTPTLLLNGDKSVRLFQLIADELADCLPDNESVRIPDSTHELPSDNPEAYNRIVMDFLEKHSGHAVNE